MRRNITLLLSTLLCLGLLASAAEDAFGQKKKRKKRKKKRKAKTEMTEESSGDSSGWQAPYGMAGCGLGSVFLGKQNSMIFQLFAATTNGFSGNQSSGISSGSSNCVKGNMANLKQEREVYVSVNLNSLEKEAAQGEGQHLRAFADILGCAQEGAYDRFSNLSQNRHADIFGSDEPNVVLDNYMQAVKADETLSASCERLGA